MGKDRLCINPDLVKASGGRASCPAFFNVIRDNGCLSCPKASGFNSKIDRSQVPQSEKIADDVWAKIRKNGIAEAASRYGRNYWILH